MEKIEKSGKTRQNPPKMVTIGLIGPNRVTINSQNGSPVKGFESWSKSRPIQASSQRKSKITKSANLRRFDTGVLPSSVPTKPTSSNRSTVNQTVHSSTDGTPLQALNDVTSLEIVTGTGNMAQSETSEELRRNVNAENEPKQPKQKLIASAGQNDCGSKNSNPMNCTVPIMTKMFYDTDNEVSQPQECSRFVPKSVVNSDVISGNEQLPHVTDMQTDQRKERYQVDQPECDKENENQPECDKENENQPECDKENENEEPYIRETQCHICLKVTSSLMLLAGHYRREHPLFCFPCGEIFLTKTAKRDHDFKHHLRKLKLNYPKHPYVFINDLQKNVDLPESHDDIDRLHSKCNICMEIFPNFAALDLHRDLKHKQQCVFCSQQFDSDVLINSHMQIAHKISTRDLKHYKTVEICSVCLLEFPDFKSLKDHVEWEHPFYCHVCWTAFKNEAGVGQHFMQQHKRVVRNMVTKRMAADTHRRRMRKSANQLLRMRKLAGLSGLTLPVIARALTRRNRMKNKEFQNSLEELWKMVELSKVPERKELLEILKIPEDYETSDRMANWRL